MSVTEMDSELNLLKQRLAFLEEQKRIQIEKEAEKKVSHIRY